MYKLGISGGVGSGKSLVLDYMRTHWNCAVYQADILAHQVQTPGEACYEKICDFFGPDILRTDRAINRERLGTIVFRDKEKLKLLNQMVHPAVDEKIKNLICMEESKGTELYVLEAALLTEERYRRMLDEIWYIRVPEDIRMKRLKTSRGYDKEKTQAIFDSQSSEEEYLRGSDRVIDNGGTFTDTCAQLEEAYRKMKEEIRKKTGDIHS